jgi:hypothetical protein
MRRSADSLRSVGYAKAYISERSISGLQGIARLNRGQPVLLYLMAPSLTFGTLGAIESRSSATTISSLKSSRHGAKPGI